MTPERLAKIRERSTLKVGDIVDESYVLFAIKDRIDLIAFIDERDAEFREFVNGKGRE